MCWAVTVCSGFEAGPNLLRPPCLEFELQRPQLLVLQFATGWPQCDAIGNGYSTRVGEEGIRRTMFSRVLVWDAMVCP